MNGFRVVFGALLLLAASSLASAQTGRVTGRVANVRGGFIGDADVTLRALPAPGTPAMPKMANMPGMGGAERTAKTQADGTFAFDQVAAGQYVLQVDFAGFERSSQEVNVASQALAVSVTLQPLEIPGAEAAPSAGGTAVDTQSLLDRIKILEQRIADLESGTILSEPETRVKRIEVYTD